MKLVIVESPTKARHISHMLGNGYQVMASVGHIRDLPLTGEMSYVRPPDFRLNYVVSDTKKDVVSNLRTAARGAGEVFLATDPDREGEAIAWHLAQVLKLDNPKRISYQEVTEPTVKKALGSPRSLDRNLIAAQEARRGLDRMIGWEVSPVLSQLIGQTSSAGRVQTPALRLIVEREREIRKFVPVDWWAVEAVFTGPSGEWIARWVAPEEHFPDGTFASRLAAAVPSLPFRVTDFARSRKKQGPPPPFTTSTLQKTASRSLGFGVEEIMQLAQSLFEQGLITYHRTDSPNLSEEGETLIRKEGLKRVFLLSEKPRRWKVKEGAQEAHEAIRPTETSISNEHSGSTDEERKLFNMIWKRTMSSQLADAEFDTVKVVLDAGTFEDRKAVFKGTGSRLLVPGWKSVYGVEEESDEEEEKANPVPALEREQSLRAREGTARAKQTAPPARFSQSTLVDALEKAGIGRPSTYASIVKVLFSKKYILEQKKVLIPTKTGEAVVSALVGKFHFSEVDYTREVEDSLDRIAQGKMPRNALLQKVWEDLGSNLVPLKSGVPSTPCPKCQKSAIRLVSKKGNPFWKCESCLQFFQDKDGGIGEAFGERKPLSSDGPPCPECGKPTGEWKTSKETPYFKCPSEHGSWWSDNGAIGKEWAPFPAKGKSGSASASKRKASGTPKRRAVR